MRCTSFPGGCCGNGLPPIARPASRQSCRTKWRLPREGYLPSYLHAAPLARGQRRVTADTLDLFRGGGVLGLIELPGNLEIQPELRIYAEHLFEPQCRV